MKLRSILPAVALATISNLHAASVLFQDDFSTNTLATNYTSLGATYNVAAETATIARATGNFLEVTQSFDLSDPATTEVTVSFNFSFGASMFGSDFDLQVDDGTGWTQLYNQIYTGTGANDSQLATNFRSDTFTSADFNFVSDVKFRLIDTNNSGSKGYTFDNLTIAVDAIPEPAAALLGSLGILGLLRRRR